MRAHLQDRERPRNVRYARRERLLGDLYSAPKDAARPANQWNQTRIVAKGSHVEHWLNGKNVAWYRRWQRRLECSHQGQQVQPGEISQLREGAERVSRHPRRPSWYAGTAQHQNSRTEIKNTPAFSPEVPPLPAGDAGPVLYQNWIERGDVESGSVSFSVVGRGPVMSNNSAWHLGPLDYAAR